MKQPINNQELDLEPLSNQVIAEGEKNVATSIF